MASGLCHHLRKERNRNVDFGLVDSNVGKGHGLLDYEAADEGHGDRSEQPKHFLRCLSDPNLIVCAVGQVTQKTAQKNVKGR